MKYKQGIEYEAGTHMDQVANRLMLPQLCICFHEYMNNKGRVLAGTEDPKQVPQLLTHYYNGLSIPVQECQGEGTVIPHACGQLSSHSGREVTQVPIVHAYDGGNDQWPLMVPMMGGLLRDWKGSSASVTMSRKYMKLQW